MDENPSWGSDRIVGALANLHIHISDSTVDNLRKRNGIPPAPERERKTTWRQFLKAHRDGLLAADFFTTEVLCWRGLITFYTLFVIELRSRLVIRDRHERVPPDDALVASGGRAAANSNQRSAREAESYLFMAICLRALGSPNPSLQQIAAQWLTDLYEEDAERIAEKESIHGAVFVREWRGVSFLQKQLKGFRLRPRDPKASNSGSNRGSNPGPGPATARHGSEHGRRSESQARLVPVCRRGCWPSAAAWRSATIEAVACAGR
jgi:hypothetical protein